MQKTLLNKLITFQIIVLIIGFISTTIVGGNNEVIDYQLQKENPNNKPLHNNYVLGYWKYDEGTGNIAYDSSGNDFNGTINGAAWINGHSGEALNFDGLDDYIALDSYSKYLGINKSDDVIYLVWFKSVSTEDGLIYSMSDKFGISNPELSIQLCSNGSILFKIWTKYCGIVVYSDGTYNDGDWHHLKILFNGLGTTGSPTVELYIDDELDGNLTKYLCPIENDEFGRVKTGRRAADETIYFDGSIDELKIIKYPDGNKQNPPTIAGPTSGQPGKEYEYTFVTDDPEGDDIWLYIDWDDGEVEDWIGPYDSEEEVTVSHEWVKEGRYEVKARSKDIWDDSSWSDSLPISIGNQPPKAPDISGPKSGDIGVEYEYIIVSTDFDGDDIYYYVDWDDGTSDKWFGPYNSGEEAIVSHSWDSDGIYEILAKVRDSYYNEGNWSDPYLISIGNQAPNAPEITGPQQGKLGIEYEYNFSLSDPDSDSIYLRVDWGSGTPSKWHGPFNSDTKVKLNYTWNKEGTFTIRAQAIDIFDKESKWSSLEITMPKTQQLTNIFLFRLFERFSVLFEKLFSIPIIQHCFIKIIN